MLVCLFSLFGLDASLILSINGVGFRIHVFWRFGGCNILYRKGGRKRWPRSTVVLQRFDISTHVIYIISLCAFLTWLMFINVLCCWTGVWLSRNVIFESVCRSSCMVLAFVRYVYQCLLPQCSLVLVGEARIGTNTTKSKARNYSIIPWFWVWMVWTWQSGPLSASTKPELSETGKKKRKIKAMKFFNFVWELVPCVWECS